MKLSIIKNKKGSSMVLLAMVFVALAICVASAITITRALVVKSEVETFGRVWTKAILSEYDNHLLEDYGIMAYFGNEAEVQKRIDSYMLYSSSNKLDAIIDKSSSELSGYELGNITNFRSALKKSFISDEISNLLNNEKRVKRDDEPNNRKIKNSVVIDTLPSAGIRNSIDIDSIVNKLKTGNNVENLKSLVENLTVETAFIYKYFNNKVTQSASKEDYFNNEWEYIINGKYDDEINAKQCKNYIFAIRNAMNLAFLYKDPEKRAVIMTVAETLSPGAGGVITQAIIAEAWALLETQKDIEALMNNERVPFVKNPDSWKTGLASVLNSEDIKSKLDEESEANLKENEKILNDMPGAVAVGRELEEGQSYDDYLMAMIILMNDNVATLRIMDLIQINMKYRYYEDFNMMEYYVGTRFTLKANGKEYEYEDSYK